MTYDTASAPERTTATSGPRAGFFQRLGAAFIDGLILFVPTVILIAVVPDAAAIIYVLYLIGSAVYYTYLEGGATGQTIGKRALGIRVYDLREGGAIGYGRGFIRWIGRIASGILLLGYLWSLLDSENQTWHDKFAGSVVVPTDAYPTN